MLNELGNVELEMIDEITGQESEGWQIKDDGQADWVIDKIRVLKAEYARKEMVAKNKIAQIEAWLKKQQDETDRQISFFEAKLREYFLNIPEKNLKTTKTQKQYKLPSGTIKLKYRGPEFKRDEEELIKWAEQRGKNEFIKIKKSFDWATYKKNVLIDNNKAIDAETGEIIDGIAVIEREPEFIVEVE